MLSISLLLISAGNAFSDVYHYDENGNLISDMSGNRYYYNAKNQLIQFIQGNTQIKSTFHYNANGLLDNQKNALKVYYFIYQQNQLSNLMLGSQKTISTLQKDVIYLTVQDHGIAYYRAAMHNNTQSLLLSQNTNLFDTNSFMPFGAKRSLRQGYTSTAQDLAMVKSLFAYDGECQDQASQLIYLHARFYNPELMRFVQRDSYDLFNRYSFANDDPINKIDPSGHNAISNGFSSFFHGLGEGLVSGMSIGFCSIEGCSTNSYKQLYHGNKSAWAEFFNPIAALVPLIHYGGTTDQWMNAIGMSLPNIAIIARDMVTTYYGYRLREQLRKVGERVKASSGVEGMQYNKLASKVIGRDIMSRRNGFNYIFNPLADLYYHFIGEKTPRAGFTYLINKTVPWDHYLARNLLGEEDSKGALVLAKPYQHALITADFLLYSINTNSLNQYNQTANTN
ncbi:RHS repeat domain-containing protein [Cysteiniphilum marinum]|nr:RHS repeat-associated core domain-containing protein [Cysteiniphilum marinum]